MKAFPVIATFIGGAALGFVAGLLTAPEKGTRTREKICRLLKEKGVHLCEHEIDELASKIEKELKVIEED